MKPGMLHPVAVRECGAVCSLPRKCDGRACGFAGRQARARLAGLLAPR